MLPAAVLKLMFLEELDVSNNPNLQVLIVLPGVAHVLVVYVQGAAGLVAVTREIREGW